MRQTQSDNWIPTIHGSERVMGAFFFIYEVLMEGRADDIVNNPDVRRLYLGEEFRL